MKFSLLKFKKNNTPPLSSLRPALFDINLYWFVALGLFCAIFLVTALIGFQLFYSVYSESYKKDMSGSVAEDIINVSKLKSSVETRINFIMEESPLPRDPAL